MNRRHFNNLPRKLNSLNSNTNEKDHYFNKIVVHIERILKITTAQTLAIDSLERKIINLSKRSAPAKQDLVVPKKPKLMIEASNSYQSEE